MVNFKEIYHLSRFQRGSNIFQGGGVQLFPGGGSNCLFSIEIHITCDFPGGPDPLPPSGSALVVWEGFSPEHRLVFHLVIQLFASQN